MPKSMRSTTTKKVSNKSWTKSSSNTSSSSDDPVQVGLFFRVAMASMNSEMSRRPKRACRRTSRNNKNTKSSVVCLDDSDDEIVPIIGVNSRNIKDNIKGKVDTFFKSGGLISDDDDEELQSFRPSHLNEPCCSKSECTNASSTEVIEVKDDCSQINSMATEFCKETANILENANALLDKFTKTSEDTSSSVSKEKTCASEPKDNQKKLLECPVCLENLSEKTIMSTKCGHVFCKECIEKVATSIKKCPICKKAVNKKNIIPIYI